MVLKCLQKRGVQLVDIANATDSDMDLQSIERLPILKDALLLAGGLRFASVMDSKNFGLAYRQRYNEPVWEIAEYSE